MPGKGVTLISQPEDYGLTADETLAHTVSSTPPADFDDFWSEFREEVESLPRAWRNAVDPDEPTEVMVSSVRSVRIVARVSCPPGPLAEFRGGVITSHGSGAEASFPQAAEPWCEHGLVTVRLRVRGYPPSTMDLPDCRSNWILRGIETPETWILRSAVADVIQCFRGLRAWLGDDRPIGLHGESLGGGLAVMAAAQLAAMGDPPHRLAIGLPSFGNWAWRAGRYCNGTGALVNEFLNTMRQDADFVVQRMGLLDAAHHAPRVPCPTLVKLAELDDVVPAPSAASIANAMPQDQLWRWITRYGHFEGGIADLRRHAVFERMHPVFLDPTRPPDEAAALSALGPGEDI
ncbi:MAG: hypothetical protein EA377_04070 [Phycisphaerales bacterium]|nr:MAG: hypothetical protein EA377_04070 [Phycisphaerales bacterium]